MLSPAFFLGIQLRRRDEEDEGPRFPPPPERKGELAGERERMRDWRICGARSARIWFGGRGAKRVRTEESRGWDDDEEEVGAEEVDPDDEESGGREVDEWGIVERCRLGEGQCCQSWAGRPARVSITGSSGPGLELQGGRERRETRTRENSYLT